MNDPASGKLAVSIIVSTYNRPDALDLVFSALADQDYPSFEVIVADDGSNEATTSLIRAHPLNQRRPLLRLWQPDDGFRKAEIHNQAILRATGEYVVFLDGDCIPRVNWLSHHATLAQKPKFVTGSKIKLSHNFTQEILAKRLPLHNSTLKDWVWMRCSRNTNHLLYFFPLPEGP